MVYSYIYLSLVTFGFGCWLLLLNREISTLHKRLDQQRDAFVKRYERDHLVGPNTHEGEMCVCVHCGPNIKIDDDGCCSSCGCDAYGKGIEYIESLRAELKGWQDKEAHEAMQ